MPTVHSHAVDGRRTFHARSARSFTAQCPEAVSASSVSAAAGVSASSKPARRFKFKITRVPREPQQGGSAVAAASARSVAAGATASRTDALRELLRSPGAHAGPCCHDALSAKLIEEAGFPLAFMSGFCTAAAATGLPDTGLISYAEMVAVGRAAHEATRSLPMIGDGDTGYGNALNVKRTVRGYALAGFAGILIEDQVAPKSCGHVRSKFVVPRDEALARIRAACDARDEGADILIVARTDARQAVSLEEALARAEAFAEAGADILFIDALESEAEMEAFTSLRGAAANVPKMASMLEGGGKTPMLSRRDLTGMRFKLVAYPLSLLGVSIKAMQDALQGLKEDRIPNEDSMPPFRDLQSVLGFDAYFDEAERYAVPDAPSPSPSKEGHPSPATDGPAASSSTATDPSASTSSKPADAGGKAGSAGAGAAAGAAASAGAAFTAGAAFVATESGEGNAIEADRVIEPDDGSQNGRSSSAQENGASEVTTAVLVREAEEGQKRPEVDLSAATLRIRITDKADGSVKLETRLPAGWMEPVSQIVPQLAAVDLEEMVSGFLGSKWTPEEPIYDSSEGKDRVQVWLEM